MTTRLELTYVLDKHFETDQFDSELPVEIPIQGQFRLLGEDAMEAAAPGANTIMGVRVQGNGNQQKLKFVRRSQVAQVVFPDVSDDSEKFRKLRFRILTSAPDHGQETDFAITYEIDSEDCRVVGANTPLGENWVALVRVDGNNNFELLYKKAGGGPQGGDPCDVWECDVTKNLAAKMKCILNGCSTNFG